MNSVDKTSRDVKIIVDSIGDLIQKRLFEARATEQTSFTDEQLAFLLKIVNASLDEGYQRALPTFQRTVSKYLT